MAGSATRVVLVKREVGGWLAIGSRYRLAAIGEDEEQATANLEAMIDLVEELLARRDASQNGRMAS